MEWLLDTLGWMTLTALVVLVIILYRQLIISSTKNKKVRLIIRTLAIIALVLVVINTIKQTTKK